MQALPHRYSVTAGVHGNERVFLTSHGLPTLASAAPSEFNGPGDQWSPETLLVAAVADCLVLTFRAVANGSKLPWVSLTCDVEGLLERKDHITAFTAFKISAHLEIPEGVSEVRAHRLLVKADETCLVTRSLKAAVQFDPEITTVAPAPA